MPYFIYASDAKIDMLYSQIEPTLLDKIAIDLNIDLKVMGTGVSIAAKQKELEETRYSKLRVLVEYIEKKGEVGWVDAPKSYFKGSLPLLYGYYPNRENVLLVYFGGHTQLTTLGLVGSPKHVLGYEGASSMSNVSPSALPDDILLETYKNEGGEQQFFSLGIVEYITGAMKGSARNYEFLARTLSYGPKEVTFEKGSQVNTLLGSPIYVAFADPI